MRTAWAFFPLFLGASVSVALYAQSMPSIVPPRLISMPAPDCRAGKPCHRNHGQVRLIVNVLEDGKAGEIRVEIGDPILADAATAAVQQADFVAGSFLGKPHDMDFVVKFNF